MGYDQNNAGLHMMPRWPSIHREGVDPIDKYGKILAEERARKKAQDVSVITSMCKDIELCNFITLWDKRGQEKRCLCGGSLKYVANVEVRFHKGDKLASYFIPGKVCTECGRKFIVKEVVMSYLQIKA